VLLATLVACSPPSGDRGLHTTVQETNVDDMPECEAMVYTRTAERDCDELAVVIHVCSGEEVCDAHLDELEAAVRDCSVDLGTASWVPSGDCP
jgi:hypothetical protein